MAPVNDFLPFCATDTGTNLVEQSAYLVSSARPIGNQPGIASSSFNNKALRQGTYVVSQLAQFLANFTGSDVLDNAVPAQLLAQMNAAFAPLAPTLTQLLTGTGTWNATYYFFISAGNATTGATYTNNSQTFTVVNTISAGAILQTTGPADPTINGGVLSKASGTGDATLTYYTFRKALLLQVEMVGGGGGGNGSGIGVGGAFSGTNSSFGTSLLVAGAGACPTSIIDGGVGGTASLGTGPVGLAYAGSMGASSYQSSAAAVNVSGGNGGATPFGGAGGGDSADLHGGGNAATNSGSGGGGGGTSTAGGSTNSGGGGGGAGGYIRATIYSPLSSYVYTVGTGGAGGAGTSGSNGGAGGDGIIIVKEFFQ